jgi:hypothetical protein
MFVLTTIPHGFCPTRLKRTCDLRALACAKILIDILNKNKIPNSSIKSTIKRSIVDVNRKKPKRITQKYQQNDIAKQNEIVKQNEIAIKYWKTFNNRIMTQLLKTQQKILLLDIHSFPKGSFDGAQIAIIDIHKKKRIKLQKFTLFVRAKLNLDVRLYKGLDNHIQNTYKKYTYPLLLEFCEDKTYLSNDAVKLFFQEVIQYFSLD